MKITFSYLPEEQKQAAVRHPPGGGEVDFRICVKTNSRPPSTIKFRNGNLP